MACLALAGPLHAELGCEQLAGVAATTVQMRDQGASLQSLLDDVERLHRTQGLARADADELKVVVQLVFAGERSPLEIFQACRAAAAGRKEAAP